MATATNTAQSGEVTGTDVSVGNSADLTAWTTVVPGVGGTIKYSTAQAFYGTTSIAFSPASAIANYVEWVGIAPSASSFNFRCLAYYTGWPSANTPVINIRSNGGGSSLVNIAIGSTGQFRIGTDVVPGSVDVSAGTVPINTWLDISLYGTNNTAGLADVLNMVVRDPTTGAIITNLSQSLTAKNFGTSTFGSLRMGRPLATGTMPISYYQWIAMTPGASAEASDVGPAWVYPTGIVSSTGFTATGGTMLAVVTDSSDTSYAATSNNPSGLIFDAQLPGIVTPVGDLIVRPKAYKLAATSGSIVGTLYQNNGTTLVSTAASASVPDTTAKYLNVVFPASDLSGVTSAQWAAGMRLKLSVTAA